ncbi:hypothetical protein [Paenibacillus macerans]|nr:hypothetical protein [Paenibacillus macerans]
MYTESRQLRARPTPFLYTLAAPRISFSYTYLVRIGVGQPRS